MSFLDLDTDVMKLILAGFPAMRLRLVCKRIKNIVEHHCESSIMLSQIGTESANQSFIQKFKFLTIGSNFGCCCSSGWFAATLASIQTGNKLQCLIINATDENIQEIIEILSRFLSLHEKCIHDLELHFEGSASQLQLCTAQIKGLSSQVQIEIVLRLVYDLNGGHARTLMANFFDSLTSSVKFRTLDLRLKNLKLDSSQVL